MFPDVENFTSCVQRYHLHETRRGGRTTNDETVPERPIYPDKRRIGSRLFAQTGGIDDVHQSLSGAQEGAHECGKKILLTVYAKLKNTFTTENLALA